MSIRSAGDRLTAPRVWSFALPRALAVALPVLAALLLAPNALAEGADALQLADRGQKALKLYDDLDFTRAKATLEQALAAATESGLDQSPIAARLHLYLGLVLAAGMQRPDTAVEQFKLACRIDPTISPPEGLFNPEVAALFAAARTGLPSDTPAPTSAGEQATGDVEPEPAEPRNPSADGDQGASAPVATDDDDQAPPPKAVTPVKKKPAPPATDGDDEEEIADEPATSTPPKPFFVALGLGAGGGTAAGHIDMKGVTPNTAPGGFAMSELGHATLTAGYFWSRSLLLALEARLQLVSGSTPHCDGSVCSEPSGFAAAVLAKASYFMGDGPLKPFGTAGLGAGNIRQIVKLNGLPDCGRSGNQQCYDTVTGGPVFIAAGGGAAYELGSVLLLGGLTANVGVPNFMLNIDLTIGAGLRF